MLYTKPCYNEPCYKEVVVYKNTWVPLYNMFHYSTVLAIIWLKDGPQNCCIQTKIWVMFIIPCRKIVAGYYGFMLVICVSVCPLSICGMSVFLSFVFWMITSINVNGFSPNLVHVCAVIFRRFSL